MTNEEIAQAAIDELVAEGKAERLENGNYRLTEAGLADTLDQARRDPEVLAELNAELAKLGVPPLTPGPKAVQ